MKYSQTTPKHSMGCDEADRDESGNSAFQYQVKTDSLRVGRSYKMQTNEPISSTHPAIRHPNRWKFIFETRFFVCSSQNEPLTPQHYSKVTLNESNAHTSEVSLRKMLQPSAFRQKRTKHRN